MMCDRVAILEKGEICEEGTLENMVERSVAFRTLFAMKGEHISDD